uniref:Putative ovule protein n=1 Tax=Solanum chacoense TaxID=4108 RepID=A0A0V0HB34_SOLCH
MSYINALSTFMLNRILCHIECTCVITQEWDSMSDHSKVFNLLFYPQKLSTTGCNCYIFCFSCRKSH